MSTMDKLLTIREVAEFARRSRSSIHRDIKSGRLETVQKVAGYNGAFLVTECAATAAYREADEA